MSLLDRVAACSAFDPDAYLPFRAAGEAVGLLRPAFARRLAAFPDVFVVSADAVDLAPGLDDADARSAAVAAVLPALAAEGTIPALRGEVYPVVTAFAAAPLMVIDRATVPAFGVRAYGVHVNGYVRRGGELLMWVGRRSLDRQVAPGKFDQMVAGGQPAGLSLRANVIKECAEEAAIPAELAARAVAVGAISYRGALGDGLKRDTLFLFDLEVPEAFTPRNTDGEIAEFMLWPLARVLETVRDTDAFKFNTSLVAIDFLIRHGIIEPDHPEYLPLIAGLHSGDG